jgi:hypothetical protein
MTYLDLRLKSESKNEQNKYNFRELKTSRDLLVLIKSEKGINFDTSCNKEIKGSTTLLGYLRQDTPST